MRKPRPFLVGFDSEDDGQGHPFLWAFTHGKGSWWTRHQGDALQYLENMVRQGREPQAWATNLEYDLVNLFGPERIAECTLRFGRSALCGARWRKVEFRDTVRHLPLSVEALGEGLGFRKVEAKLFQRGPLSFARYLRRCQRDAAITYRAAVKLAASYGRLGAYPRMTLASTALAVWRDRYWPREVVRPTHEVWAAALEAYHGGRTQAFAVGSFEDVQVLDVASMFPWAMVAAPLPLPWGLFRRVGPGSAVRARGIYWVRVEGAGALPVRCAEGTIYPTGRWSAWYVGEELLHAQECGARVQVLHGFEFLEQCRPFDGYVRAMFRRKQRARGMDRTLYKLLLNALYGKFGQQGRQVRAIPLAKLLTLKNPPSEWRAWCGLAIYTTEQAPPPWGNNVWPAFVTARARVRLARQMRTLRERGARVLYCDTDSIIYQGEAGRFPVRARQIGEFELRGRFRRFLCVGKKEYGLDLGRGRWELHAKGVPFTERERYLLTGEAEFERPVRLREGARSGETVNVWRRVRKVRRLNLKMRAAADGALPVPEIFE